MTKIRRALAVIGAVAALAGVGLAGPAHAATAAGGPSACGPIQLLGWQPVYGAQVTCYGPGMAHLYGSCGSGGFAFDFESLTAGQSATLRIECYNRVLDVFSLSAGVTAQV